MKNLNLNLLFLIIALAISVASCTNQELSRENVISLLSPSLPPQIISIDENPHWMHTQGGLSQYFDLVKIGVITLTTTKTFESANGETHVEYYKVSVTDEGRKYYIGKGSRIDMNLGRVNQFIFKGYTTKIKDISISSNAKDKSAMAEVILENYDISPFQNVCQPLKQTEWKTKYLFNLYDSGWKIVENGNHNNFYLKETNAPYFADNGRINSDNKEELESNIQNTNTTTEIKVEYKISDTNAQTILLGMWFGLIGKKQFTLSLDKISNGKISGYNIAGTNKRPVSGSYSFFRGGNACTLSLSEPGDDKWDGTFVIEMDVYSDNWAGNGIWKAFNGNLSNPVAISRRIPDNPNDFVIPLNSKNPADKMIGIWTNAEKDELKISKSGSKYKVIYHPNEDDIFDFIGFNRGDIIRCPFGQDNMDSIEISIANTGKIKFVAEWDSSNPGPETYYFNK